MTITDTDTSVSLSKEAIATIRAMHGHVQALGHEYGESSSEYALASASLVGRLVDLFSWSNLRVTKDGHLSLFCAQQPTGMVFGLIWHGTQRRCQIEGCHAVINDDGQTWAYDRERFPILDHEHKPTYPLSAPQPGTWSFHS